MKLLIIFMVLFIFVWPKSFFAQKNDEKSNFGIRFTGFVKNDAFYDTRQTTAAREGHFLLFPAPVVEDENGKDINAHHGFNILSIQTRLTGAITGPDAFGAKTSGVIEGAFFGNTEADINGFRLRHAFARFNWEKTELIAGQYWHPLFVPQAFPEVISFNTGVPFKPFSRNPQLRLTQKLGNFSVSATVFSQRDFAGPGPQGTSSIYMRNAAVPNTNLLVTYSSPETENIFGVGGDYKIIVPEIVTDKNYKTDNSLHSLSAMAFSKISVNNTTWKIQALLGQNVFDLLMIGGYGVKHESYDTITGTREYTNLNTASFWTELYTNIGQFQAGFFAGFSKNLGSLYNIMPDSEVYARGANIDYVYRISPRFLVKQGNSTIALELEHTTAAYGQPNSLGEVKDTEEISNLRALLSFIYHF